MGTGIVVLGMHRSGTSLTMQLLAAAGAAVGSEEQLTGKGRQNPHGFFERKEVRALCDQLLHSARADWWKVLAFDPAGLAPKPVKRARLALAKVVNELDQSPLWAIKEPRLSLLYPALSPRLGDHVCVIPLRHPVEVALSLRQRNNFPLAVGLALWEAYMRTALAGTDGKRRLLVSHQRLIADPEATIAALLNGLAGLGVEPLRTARSAAVVAGSVDPDCYRSRIAVAPRWLKLPPAVAELWSQLESIGQTGDLAAGSVDGQLGDESAATLDHFECFYEMLRRQQARSDELAQLIAGGGTHESST